MSLWSLLSVVALAAASVPSVYFAYRMRERTPRFAGLSVLLAAALLVHAGFHVIETLAGSAAAVLAVEAISAALILTFALAYWPLRRGDRPGP